VPVVVALATLSYIPVVMLNSVVALQLVAILYYCHYASKVWLDQLITGIKQQIRTDDRYYNSITLSHETYMKWYHMLPDQGLRIFDHDFQPKRPIVQKDICSLQAAPKNAGKGHWPD
jgi:hypothetical protein